jgi:Tannase-like family of unknown function (DUF6351)
MSDSSHGDGSRGLEAACRKKETMIKPLMINVFAAVAVGLLPAGAAGGADAQQDAIPTVEAVSTLPEWVSGGSVLVRVTAPAVDQLVIERDSVDVTSLFRHMSDGSLLGLVGGLDDGRHTIIARAPAAPSGRLELVNHPITGPLFSGPQQQPFFCETAAAGLGPALDSDCSAPTQVTYRYRTTAGTFAVLADPTVRPADLAQTTVDGRTVDYIVRLERGTIDRSIYEVAALYDPAAPPNPFTAEPGWNERLVYTFGGGCNVGYHQGLPLAGPAGVLNDRFLSRGYGVASSSLNVLDNNCSDVISAEVALMVKEHVIEVYGVPRYTIGWGGSGGAIQQQLIANNYPGIVDGIVPAGSFPDTTTLDTVSDCRLLARYFASSAASALGWTPVQQAAASGFGTFASCNLWHLDFGSRVNALEACPSAIPVESRYDPVTNPDGVRCTYFEQLANQLGRNPVNGFVWRPLDNVGVQYGLTALMSGTISPEQFVSLNDNVGGYDVIGLPVAERTAADELGLQRAYKTGRANDFGLGAATTPIIDIRTYTDSLGDIHTRFWSFVERKRLLDANGTAANHVMFVSNNAGTAAMQVEALTQMDRWLAAIQADTDGGSEAARVIRNRPATLSDACWTSATTRIDEPFGLGLGGTCATLYPIFGDTRLAAGEGLADDILKCRLKPIDFDSYGVALTVEQKARLVATFPTGVCDWSKEGFLQQPAKGPWLDFTH